MIEYLPWVKSLPYGFDQFVVTKVAFHLNYLRIVRRVQLKNFDDGN